MAATQRPTCKNLHNMDQRADGAVAKLLEMQLQTIQPVNVFAVTKNLLYVDTVLGGLYTVTWAVCDSIGGNVTW